jgi:hypothetical protein
MAQLGLGVAKKLKNQRKPIAVADRVGVEFPRYFTQEGKSPYDEVVWSCAPPRLAMTRGR